MIDVYSRYISILLHRSSKMLSNRPDNSIRGYTMEKMHANEMGSMLVKAVAQDERLRSRRVALTGMVETPVKEIDKERKALKDSLVKAIKSFAVTDALNVVNSSLPPSGGDDAQRKRAERGRAYLVSVLSKAFASYDFSVSSTRGRYAEHTVVASYVGDKFTRQAREMLATYDAVLAMASKHGAESVTEESLVAWLKAEESCIASEPITPVLDADTASSIAVSALVSLGYTREQAQSMAKQQAA